MSNIIKQIFKSFDFEGTAEQLKSKLKNFELPADAPTKLMDYMMERSYLEDISSRPNGYFIPLELNSQKPIAWMKILRLPIHPSTEKEYDIMSKWQTVLSSIHAWGQKTIFLLQRKEGITN